jgi:MIP family channel proteins
VERRSAPAAAVEQKAPTAYVAEFIGTFALVFFITSVVVLFVTPGGGGGSDYAVVGLVHALLLFLLVQSLGSISGAHLNPAITLGLAALRKIKPNDAVVYILLQLAGAVAGALMTKFILSDRVADGTTAVGGVSANVGTPSLNDSGPNALLGGVAQGFVAEAIGTFFLVWAVIAVAVNPRATRDWAGLAIGGTLGFGVMVLGPLTGGSLNPARWFGPALVSNHFTDAWLYILAPLVGGVLAALTYWYLFVESGGFRSAAPEAGPRGLRQDVNPPGGGAPRP